METIRLGQIYRCPEHGTMGMLPCAWKGCAHGINGEGFLESPLLENEERESYTRRRWTSPLGGDYFTWESSKMSNWFFLRQTYWNEARRNKLIPDTELRTVYHYTSLEGLLGIISSKSIWLSDYSYLNDSRELDHGASVAAQAIDSLLKKSTDPASTEVLSAWRDQIQRIPNRVCIASFTEDGDSLAQWRAYGPIAIGFDVRALSLHVDQSTLTRVEYNPDVQQKLLAVYLNHASLAAARDAENDKFLEIRDEYLKSEPLLEIIAHFKDSAFATEREVRLAHIDNPELYGSLGFERLPKNFRVARGRLLPYVQSTQVLRSKERNFPLEISDIVLGPGSDDLLARGVREYLDEQGLASVPVRRSIVPFRT